MATNDPKPLTGCPDKTLELDRMKIWTFCFSLDKTRILCSNKPIVPPPAATYSSISGMIPWDVVWVAGSSRMLSFSSISQGPRVFCLLPNEEESSTPLCTCSSSKKEHIFKGFISLLSLYKCFYGPFKLKQFSAVEDQFCVSFRGKPNEPFISQ